MNVLFNENSVKLILIQLLSLVWLPNQLTKSATILFFHFIFIEIFIQKKDLQNAVFGSVN